MLNTSFFVWFLGYAGIAIAVLLLYWTLCSRFSMQPINKRRNNLAMLMKNALQKKEIKTFDAANKELRGWTIALWSASIGLTIGGILIFDLFFAQELALMASYSLSGTMMSELGLLFAAIFVGGIIGIGIAKKRIRFSLSASPSS